MTNHRQTNPWVSAQVAEAFKEASQGRETSAYYAGLNGYAIALSIAEDEREEPTIVDQIAQVPASESALWRAGAVLMAGAVKANAKRVEVLSTSERY